MKDEQRNYLLQAAEDLETAKMMLKKHRYRVAISRAYYAMLYTTLAILLERNRSFSSPPAVLAAFGQQFTSKGLVPKEYHQYLSDAQEKRGQADYDFISQMSAEDAKEVIGHAQQFVALGEQMLGPVNVPETEAHR